MGVSKNSDTPKMDLFVETPIYIKKSGMIPPKKSIHWKTEGLSLGVSIYIYILFKKKFSRYPGRIRGEIHQQ